MISGKYKEALSYIKKNSQSNEFISVDNIFGKSFPLKDNPYLFKIIEELKEEGLIDMQGGFITPPIITPGHTQKTKYKLIQARLTIKGESALNKSKSINWSFWIFLVGIISLILAVLNYKINQANKIENRNDNLKQELESIDLKSLKNSQSSIPYSIFGISSNHDIYIVKPPAELIAKEKVIMDPRFVDLYNYHDDDYDGLIDEGTFPGKYITKLEFLKDTNMNEYSINLELSKKAKYDRIEIQYSNDLNSFTSFFNNTLESGAAKTKANDVILYSFSTKYKAEKEDVFFRVKLIYENAKQPRHAYSEIIKIENKNTPGNK